MENLVVHEETIACPICGVLVDQVFVFPYDPGRFKTLREIAFPQVRLFFRHYHPEIDDCSCLAELPYYKNMVVDRRIQLQ